MLGRTVYEIFNGTIPTGNKNFFLQANQFDAGIYEVVMHTGSLTLTQKLVIR
jgi:hypothetical protein